MNQNQQFQPGDFQQTKYEEKRIPKNENDKHGFSLMGFILDIIFSPLLFLIIGYFLYQDIQKAILFGLIVLTGLTLLRLIFRILALGLSALTLNILGFVLNSVRIFIALFMVGVYWLIYIFIFGYNFNL